MTYVEELLDDIAEVSQLEYRCDTCEHNNDAELHGSCRQYPCGQQNCWHSCMRESLEKELADYQGEDPYDYEEEYYET